MTKKSIKIVKNIGFKPSKKGVEMYIIRPFEETTINKYYAMLGEMLEWNTNRLMMKNEKGILIPVEHDHFSIIFGIGYDYAMTMIRTMFLYRIIMAVHLSDHSQFFVNPNFMFYGDTIPSLLMDIFKQREISSLNKTFMKWKVQRPEWNKKTKKVIR